MESDSENARLPPLPVIRSAVGWDRICPIGNRVRLARAETIGEVKELRDFGASAIAFAKRRRMGGVEQLNDAQESVLDAERKLGEMLAGMEMPGRGGGDTKSSNTTLLGPSLADLNITKMQSSRWQKVAAIPGGAVRQGN